MNKKRIAIVGLFSDTNNAPVTQASELAAILKRNGYELLTVSRYHNKWLRLLDIIITLTLSTSKYDIAIVQFYSGNSFIWQSIAAKIAKRFNKKLAFTIHGGGVPAAIGKQPAKYLGILKSADIITAPSGYIIQSLSKYNLNPVLVENTIRLKNYEYKKREQLQPILLWMRAFSDIYNPHMAVRVIAALKQYYLNVKMYMGGPDLGQLESTQQLITELDVADNIEIVGFMNFEKKEYYTRLADIYISTNTVDNAPVTFLEMWAWGLPVISTNVGGIPFLVEDNKTGMLVNNNDHEAMAKKIRQLLEDKKLTDKIIHNAYTKVEDYDENVVFEKWDKLLSAL